MKDNSQPTISVYDKSFWLAYVALILIMAGCGLVYRYADFVFFLGGTEFHLGWIVGVGMGASLLMRLFLGVWVDRYGVRAIWTGSLLLLSVSCLGHLLVNQYDSWPIYLLRIGFACGVAGTFTANITFASNRVPNNRVAESLGMLGTAGFVGIMTGTQLGDRIFSATTVQSQHISGMFIAAAASIAMAIPFIWMATIGMKTPRRKRQPSMFRLLRRYHPGVVILVGVITGLGICLPEAFLRAFAVKLNISKIAIFFTAYALTTICVRLAVRRLAERVGLKPVIFFGLICLATSMASFVFVHSYWQLAIPGIGFGLTQAVLVPSVFAAANTKFPVRFRGLGSTLVLAAYDLGAFVGAPTAGVIVHFSDKMGLPSYPILFVVIATMVTVVALIYAVVPERQIAPRRLKPHIISAALKTNSIDLPADDTYHPPVPCCHTVQVNVKAVDSCADFQQCNSK